MPSFADITKLALATAVFSCYWSCNDAVGTTAADASANALTLTKFGTTTTFQSASGTPDGEKSVAFSADAGVENGSFGRTPSAFTVILMVKMPSSGTGPFIACGSFDVSSFWFGLSSGSLHVDDGRGHTASSATAIYNDGAWHQIAVRRTPVGSNTTLDLFVDGANVGTTGSVLDGGGSTFSLSKFCVGNFGSGLASFGWPGLISKVVYAEAAISDVAILQDYNDTMNAFTSSVTSLVCGRQSVSAVLTRTAGPNWNSGANTPIASVRSPISASGYQSLNRVVSSTVVDANTMNVVYATDYSDSAMLITTTDGGGTTVDASGTPYTSISTVVVSGQNVKKAIPLGYTGASPVTAVKMLHGYSGSEDWTANGPGAIAFANVMCAAGFIVYSTNRGSPTEYFGNGTAMDLEDAAFTYMSANYNIKNQVFVGISMGNLTACNLMQKRGQLPLAYIGIYGVFSQNYVRDSGNSTWVTDQRAAYGIAGDGSDYVAKMAGNDPMVAPATLFPNGGNWIFFASPSDTVVSKTSNTDAMSTHLGARAARRTTVVCSGDHGDQSHWQPSVALAFIQGSTQPSGSSTGSDHLDLSLSLEL